LERLRKEAVMDNFEVFPHILLEALKRIQCQDSGSHNPDLST
jgi:hypothetical protein